MLALSQGLDNYYYYRMMVWRIIPLPSFGARTAPQWAQLQVRVSLVEMELCDWEPERGSDRAKLLPSSVSHSNSFPRTGNTPQVYGVQNSCYKCSLNQRWIVSCLKIIYNIRYTNAVQFWCAYSEMYSLIYAFIKSIMKWSFEMLLGPNLYSRCICLLFVWHIQETVSHCGPFPTHAQRNRSIFVSQMYTAHITTSWCTFYVCLDAYLREQSVTEISSNERLRLKSVNYSCSFPAFLLGLLTKERIRATRLHFCTLIGF